MPTPNRCWSEDAERFHRGLLGASTFFERLLQDGLDEIGLTPSQFYVLKTIASSPAGALSPRELQRSFVRKRNLTETVDRVVRDGLATRRPNPHDGRSVRIALTDQGRALLPPATRIYQRSLHRLLDGRDEKQLAGSSTLLEQLTDDLRATLYPDLPGPVEGRPQR